MKLNVWAFGLTCAVLWGLGLFVLTWWVIFFEGAEAAAGMEGLLTKVYRGYEMTAVGSLIGLVWAFFDALIGGVIFAWLYNRIAGRMASGASAD